MGNFYHFSNLEVIIALRNCILVKISLRDPKDGNFRNLIGMNENKPTGTSRIVRFWGNQYICLIQIRVNQVTYVVSA